MGRSFFNQLAGSADAANLFCRVPTGAVSNRSSFLDPALPKSLENSFAALYPETITEGTVLEGAIAELPSLTRIVICGGRCFSQAMPFLYEPFARAAR